MCPPIEPCYSLEQAILIAIIAVVVMGILNGGLGWLFWNWKLGKEEKVTR